MRGRNAAALLCLLLAAPTVAQEAPRPLAVDDLFALKDVRDPRISPEGDWVAYTVTTTRLEDETSTTRIWMVPFGGGEPLPMTAEGQSANTPRWSPDGRYLTFLASRNDEKAQVWALDRRGGEAVALTEVAQGVGGYAWSPDGTRLALLIRDPEEEHEGETPPPHVVDRLQFKRDGAGYLDRRRTRLYVQDLDGTEPRALTSGDFDDADPTWSPDGRRIAFVSNRTEEPDANDDTNVWVVSVDGDAAAAPRQVTRGPGSDGSPAWSPDGRWIAHTTVTEPGLIWYATTHLAVTPSEGGESRVLTTALDRNVGAPAFSPDGAWIRFQLEDSAEDHWARIPVDGGPVERVVAGPRSVRSVDSAPDGRTVAIVGELSRPDEVYALEPGAEPRRLTDVNTAFMEGIALGAVENVQFPSGDGTEVEGFIYLPPDYREGTRYPTLLRIHGGPVSQYRHAFNFEPHLFAASGYVVVLTNPRGSSGYGQDFSSVLWADWGNPDFQDVMAGVDHAVSLGYADPDRLGVGGWSYGGILTNYVITKTDRFKAAVTGASEVLYVANYGHDHYQRQWEAELGLPWENREAWERISPFNDVENVTTPTLIMGGAEDWNVPIQNSEQLYQALRRRGVETQLVVYPGESHGIRTPSYRKDRLERYLDWYGRYLGVTSSNPVTFDE